MTEHPNSLLIHHFLQALTAGDAETLRALWADDIIWYVKGNSPYQGEIKGADDIFEYLADLGDAAELGALGFHVEVEDILVSGKRAAALCNATAERGDKVLHARHLLVARIIDRRIQSVTSVPIDSDRVDEFWRNNTLTGSPLTR